MTTRRVVYVVATAAPPVLDLPRLFASLHERQWVTCPILTPTAASWVDVPNLAKATGFPVRVELKLPGEEDPLPEADAVLAAPLSFNTLNKWAAGISDTVALGILNELLGTTVPIVAAPCAKSPLRAHPAYMASIKLLSDSGVTFLDPERAVLRTAGGLVTLDRVLLTDALESAVP